MNIGQVVEAMKQGYKCTRHGWNGKNMFVYYVPSAKYPSKGNKLGTMDGLFKDDLVPYQAYIAMKTADNTVVPWLCSQSDLLATDWEVM